MTSSRVQPTDASHDVIVIGGGPVGSYAALNLGEQGIRATVFEEHPQIGLPSHCAGHISIRSLKKMGLYPLPRGVEENTFCAANFYSPFGTKFTLRLSRPVTVALNRARFDRYLAVQAEKVGANFVLGSRVRSLLRKNGLINGVSVIQDGAVTQHFSKVVLDAEGISCRLLRQAGLGSLNCNGLVYAVEAEVECVKDVSLDTVEVYFGTAFAPGFYGWLIPRPDGSAKVGLATNKGNPHEHLQRLMHKHPVAKGQLEKAKITKIGYHAITLGGPINRNYADGFLAVGDCASQVKPTTGGGVIFGLAAAKVAAEVASQAIAQGDVSSRTLQIYQKRCRMLFNFDFQVMLRLRRFLNSLSDAKIDEMLQVCGKLGVDKALRDVAEIDFQGQMLLKAMQKPAVGAALAYFGLLYLSANA